MRQDGYQPGPRQTAAELADNAAFLSGLLSPALSPVGPGRRLLMWNVGSLDHAVTLALAAHDMVWRGLAADARVFHTGSPPEWRTLQWRSSRGEGGPEWRWLAPVEGRSNRWVPVREVLDRIVLGEPPEPVDVLSDDRTGPGPDRPGARIKQGGLLLVMQPGGAGPGPGFELLGAEGRLSRKVDAPSEGGAPPAPPQTVVRTLARHVDEVQLMESHLNLARFLARRFRNRGEPLEDLEQVATLALFRAAGRYSPDRGEFTAFAAQYVLGELRHHFRDRLWTIRMPRSLQDTLLAARAVGDELAQSMRASPTTKQIAEHLGTTDGAVRAAMQASMDCWPVSLDAPTRDGDEDGRGTDLPVLETGFDSSLDHQVLREAMARLNPTEKKVIRRIYFDGWSQAQVGREMGVSQMQVSRLIAGAFAQLRRPLRVA